MIDQLKHLSEALKGAKITMEVEEKDYDVIFEVYCAFPSEPKEIMNFTLNSTEFIIKKKV